MTSPDLQTTPMRATYQPDAVLLGGAVLFAASAVWAVQHALSAMDVLQGRGSQFAIVFMLAFALLMWQTVLCFFERPFTTTSEQQAASDASYVALNVPCYNEDPGALRACLESMLNQTRPPNLVHVVDDGSTVDYSETSAWFELNAPRHGVEAHWTRQDNAGKRSAQGATVRLAAKADFFVTVDSDAILDPNAIEEGLKPFADRRVMSVAGVVMLANVRTNLLTRASELWFVVGQMIDRSAMSAMGGVLVNSGALAFYRADLLRRHLDGYLNESFFGRRVGCSDDSMLTIYALMEGRAVQQPTAFAFTLMPERYSHHRRQYVRWMRGASSGRGGGSATSRSVATPTGTTCSAGCRWCCRWRPSASSSCSCRSPSAPRCCRTSSSSRSSSASARVALLRRTPQRHDPARAGRDLPAVTGHLAVLVLRAAVHPVLRHVHMSQDRVGHAPAGGAADAFAGTGLGAGDAGSGVDPDLTDVSQGRSAVGATTAAKGFPADFSRVASQTDAPARSGKSARTAVTASRQNVAEAVSESLPTLVPMPILRAGTP